MKKLKNDFEAAVHAYCEEFAKKHELYYDPDFWVGGRIGEVICFGDFYVQFSDIRYDLDNNIQKDKYWIWEDLALEAGLADEHIVTYDNWLRGAKFQK